MNTQVAPTPVDAPIATSYASIAVGLSPNTHLIVAGVTAGKTGGQPSAAAVQCAPYGSGNWTRQSKALSGPIPGTALTDLVITADLFGTEVLGLGNDGVIYRCGREAGGVWAPGTGKFPQGTAFVPGSLSAQFLNTSTAFAVAAGSLAPWAAIYRDNVSKGWKDGFALPNHTAAKFTSLRACPDMSGAGTVHVIGITSAGSICETATVSGGGCGPSQTWVAGSGNLGQSSGLPAFQQVVLVSGDGNGNFHAIGLGTDGSIWDVDQFTPSTSAWSRKSTCIVAARQFTGDKIACYLSSTKSLLLVGSTAGSLSQLASYAGSWTAVTTPIPAFGLVTNWHLVPNPVTGTNTDAFILGVANTGLVYEVADYQAGKWVKGPAGQISG